MMLKRNKIMLMPPSIEKTKYMKIYKGTEMKYVKMTKTLTALYARNMQQKHGLFEFSPVVKLPRKSAFLLGTLPSVLLGLRKR